MKKYKFLVPTSGYVRVFIEAENEDEAIDKYEKSASYDLDFSENEIEEIYFDEWINVFEEGQEE